MRSPRITRHEKSRTTGGAAETEGDPIGLEHHLAAGLGRAGLQPHQARLGAAAGALGAHRHQRAHAAFVRACDAP